MYLLILKAKWFSNSLFSVHCKQSSVKALVRVEENCSEGISKSLGHGCFLIFRGLLIFKELLSVLEFNSVVPKLSFRSVNELSSPSNLIVIQGGYKEDIKAY